MRHPVLAALLALTPGPAGFAAAPAFPVAISVDAAAVRGELKPIYRFFGGDEPNYTTMKDGRRLLRDIGKLGEPREYFRTHNLLNTGDAPPPSSGAAPMPTPRTPPAARFTTGRFSTASSTSRSPPA